MAIIGKDAENKLWELQKISLSRQPQTNDDASTLSQKFSDIVDALEDQIRMANGKQSMLDLRDGEMMQVQ